MTDEKKPVDGRLVRPMLQPPPSEQIGWRAFPVTVDFPVDDKNRDDAQKAPS